MGSIIIYGATFFMSIMFARIIEVNKRIEKHRIIYILLLVAILIPPCLLAGIRAESVGVDTQQYIKQYEYASTHKSYLTIYGLFGKGTEIVIAAIVYVLANLNVTVTEYLFVLQLLAFLPVLLMGIKLKKVVPLSWIIACYLFLFYNNSLNLARQSIAVAWLALMAIILLLNNNRLKGKSLAIILCGAIGTFAHKSGIIGLFLILFCCFFSNRNMKLSKKVVIYFTMIFALVFSPSILEWFMSVGLITKSLTWYSDLFITHTVYRDYFINPFGIYGIPDMLIRLALVILPAIAIDKKCVNHVLHNGMKGIVAIGFSIFTVVLFALSTNYGQRISMYLDFMLVAYIPYGITHSKVHPKKGYLYLIIITYWLVWVFAFGWSGSANFAIRAGL